MVYLVINQSFKQKGNPEAGYLVWANSVGWEQGERWVGLDSLNYLDRSISRVTPHLREGETNGVMASVLCRDGLWGWWTCGLWQW